MYIDFKDQKRGVQGDEGKAADLTAVNSLTVVFLVTTVWGRSGSSRGGWRRGQGD